MQISPISTKRPKVGVAADGRFELSGFWAPNEARPRFRALGVLAAWHLGVGAVVIPAKAVAKALANPA